MILLIQRKSWNYIIPIRVQLVDTIVAKNGTVELYSGNLPTGMYFYQIKADNYNEVKKMMLIRYLYLTKQFVI